MTDKQKKAITQLKRAVTSCKKSGVNLFGMDFDILAVTDKAVTEYKKSGIDYGYGEDANAYKNALEQMDMYEETATVCQFGGCGGW